MIKKKAVNELMIALKPGKFLVQSPKSNLVLIPNKTATTIGTTIEIIFITFNEEFLFSNLTAFLIN